MIKKDFKNLSNYFSFVGDIGYEMVKIMDSSSEAVFGVEMQKVNGVTDTMLVTPPYIRLGEEARISRLADAEYPLTYYEGYLTEPHFLPIYDGLNGALMDDLKELEVDGNISIQWLFRKRLDDWKDTALAMYKSYLEGNESPAVSYISRAIQDRVLSALNKLSSFDTFKAYVDDVDGKLLDTGFQFQLLVAMQTEKDKVVAEQLETIFQRYDSHNSLRLFKLREKKTPRLFREGILSNSTQSQILSQQEIISLFVSKSSAPVIKAPERAATDVIRLLPEYKRMEVRVDGDIANKIARAMKRISIMKTAQLHNESIIAGIRLTVVQCDIPKDKTLTHITQKAKDIQAELGVNSLGVEQGDTAGTVKFSIPNEEAAIISLRELIEDRAFQEYAKNNPLAFIVGVDEINNPIYLSLAKLVHLLVAGTTGSGKSVFINTLVVALISTYTPEQLRMYMIDPKEVELQQYNGFPHVEEVITDMDEAEQLLEGLTAEMDRRYTTFRENGVKNISLYNQKMDEPMPYIVCVIDEYADLKDTHKEVEDYVARLGQKARAAGIHLVIATQRPSANIISGRIKANIPNTISFNLSNNNNYKTVFGHGIPYTLLGRGDGVMKIEGYPKPLQRFQSAIISPDESIEEQVYDSLKDYYSDFEIEPLIEILDEQGEVLIEKTKEIKNKRSDSDLINLKKIIARTKETRVEPLREELGLQTVRMKELMTQLVEEGWLIRHKSTKKGYELAVSEEELSEYLS